MTQNEPEFTIGVEEEYLLVDRETRGLVVDPPASLLSECEELLDGQVTTELLRSQIEVGTKVCQNVQEAREELRIASAEAQEDDVPRELPAGRAQLDYLRRLEQQLQGYPSDPERCQQ